MPAIRKYTSFPRLVDKQEISQHHINNIEEVVNEIQVDNIRASGKTFLDDCLFALNHNPYINSMDYIEFSNNNEILNNGSSGYMINQVEKCLQIKDNTNLCTMYTVTYKSKYEGTINNFILRADADIPRGCTIKYYIGQDINNMFPIVDGEGQPRYFTTAWNQVIIKIEMTKNSIKQTPRLFEISLLYEDSKIKNEITDVMQEINDAIVTSNVTKLHYQDDKVVQITTDKGSTTDIVYTNDRPTKITKSNGRTNIITEITYNSDDTVDTISTRYE
jgi:hypothetical protein